MKAKLSKILELSSSFAIGLAIFLTVVGIPGERLYGDDATIWTYVISLFSKQFPYPQWDQCCFAGYQPAGLGLTILLPQALFVKIGFPVALVLHYSFLASFLLL